jgi:transcriptional regulator with XRE-family HTH domain
MATVHAVPKSPEGARAVENIRLTVRALLAVREMTALELGQHLGLSRARIYDRMQGRKAFTVDEVAYMSRLFNVPVQVLFDGPDALFSGPSDGLRQGSIKGLCWIPRLPRSWGISPPVTDRFRTSVNRWGLAA